MQALFRQKNKKIQLESCPSATFPTEPINHLPPPLKNDAPHRFLYAMAVKGTRIQADHRLALPAYWLTNSGPFLGPTATATRYRDGGVG